MRRSIHIKLNMSDKLKELTHELNRTVKHIYLSVSYRKRFFFFFLHCAHFKFLHISSAYSTNSPSYVSRSQLYTFIMLCSSSINFSNVTNMKTRYRKYSRDNSSETSYRWPSLCQNGALWSNPFSVRSIVLK